MGLAGGVRLKWNQALNRVGRGVRRRRYSEGLKRHGLEEPPEWLKKRAAVTQREVSNRSVWIIRPRRNPSGRAILYLPGCPLAGPDKRHTRFALRLAVKTGAEVWLTCSPADSGADYAQALHFAEQVYNELRHVYAKDVVSVCGDSWGACLALGLCQRVSRQPSHLILLSPVAGQEAGLSADLQRKTGRGDPLLTRDTVEAVNEKWMGGTPADSPLYNPSFADCAGLPPVLLIHGKQEIFYPHVEILRHRLMEAGIPLRTLRRNLYHTWMLDRLPEAYAALREIRFTINA
ncbi:MAG: alpha/beta hydrolase [Clostridia bacterium]|nr:alpha/beta hydrolase [Clostridia bacterium]